MRFQVRWHLFRRPIYVLDRVDRHYYLQRIDRVIGCNGDQTVVRYEGEVCRLYPKEQLVKFYWRKVGTFGRKTKRPDAPRFMLGSREILESELDLPFLKQWEETLGTYY